MVNLQSMNLLYFRKYWPNHIVVITLKHWIHTQGLVSEDQFQNYTTTSFALQSTLLMPTQSWMPRFISALFLTPDYNSPECNKNANCIFSPEIQFTCITKPGDQWCCPQTRDYRTNFPLYRFFLDHCRQTRTNTTVKPLYNTVYQNVISHITWKLVNAGYWSEYELTKIPHTSTL